MTGVRDVHMRFFLYALIVLFIFDSMSVNGTSPLPPATPAVIDILTRYVVDGDDSCDDDI